MLIPVEELVERSQLYWTVVMTGFLVGGLVGVVRVIMLVRPPGRWLFVDGGSVVVAIRMWRRMGQEMGKSVVKVCPWGGLRRRGNSSLRHDKGSVHRALAIFHIGIFLKQLCANEGSIFRGLSKLITAPHGYTVAVSLC